MLIDLNLNENLSFWEWVNGVGDRDVCFYEILLYFRGKCYGKMSKMVREELIEVLWIIVVLKL